MNITVNGSRQDCPPDSNISALLERLDLQGKRIALEINKEIVPRSEYDSFALTEGDTVEIIQAIGGG